MVYQWNGVCLDKNVDEARGATMVEIGNEGQIRVTEWYVC